MHRKNPELSLQPVPASTKFKAYNGTPVYMFGVVVIPCIRGRYSYHVKFYVTNGEKVLGSDDSECLEYVKRIESIKTNEEPKILKEFKDVFEETVEVLSNKEMNIEVKPRVDPIMFPLRRIPFVFHKPLNITLDDLENKRIIKKLDYSKD